MARFALVAGVTFAIIGLIYWFVQRFDIPTHDLQGAVLLIVLGIAMAFGFSVLVRGSRDL